MRKFIIIGCVWFGFATTILTSNAKAEIEYQINYDSQTKDTYAVKENIQSIYSELVSGVHKESYIVMILHNKDKFAYKKNMKVDWKDNVLRIREGDGKGDEIKGMLKTESVCMAEVQPRSLLQEIFDSSEQ